jgi:glycerol dehydrogenase-like iron-containing ADH family enzyme
MNAVATAPPAADRGFRTVFGRELVAELPNIVHRPYLVVTMADLWPWLEHNFDRHLVGVHEVTSIELSELDARVDGLPDFAGIVGLGGGRALDVAKFFAWRRGRPLFQVPTAMTTNAAFNHRCALRHEGREVGIGWAVPEAVYVDVDLIRTAPALLNRSGVADVLCHHTATVDWKLAHDAGREDRRWPYDERLVAEARHQLEAVVGGLDEIHDVSDAGIRLLVAAHRWAGASFHEAGWNACHLDGVDHAFQDALEFHTGRHFIHGQAIGLGTYLGSVLQENEPERVLGWLHRAGVDIRPEAMGIDWEATATAMRRLAWYVRHADLPYTIADVRPVTDAIVDGIRDRITATFGAWTEEGPATLTGPGGGFV